MIHHLPAQAYEQRPERDEIKMDNKQMIEVGVQMLQSIDPIHVEDVEVERSQYDDGSARFSVSVVVPAKLVEKSE